MVADLSAYPHHSLALFIEAEIMISTDRSSIQVSRLDWTESGPHTMHDDAAGLDWGQGGVIHNK